MPDMTRIDEATLAILSRVTIDNHQIFLTCGQLDRKQYLAVNTILEAMNGKWNRKSKSHVFSIDPTEKLESVLLTGEISEPKKNGYFPTPPDLAKKIVEMAEVEPGMMVLEPSAGQGGIADYIPSSCNIHCIELLPENVRVLLEKGYEVEQADFLTIDPAPQYDRVLMNPPFELQQDINHVSHAWKFVAPGGKLISIMSAGVAFRENRKTVEFRAMMDRYGYMERLPDASFKLSGTLINTVLVVMENL